VSKRRRVYHGYTWGCLDANDGKSIIRRVKRLISLALLLELPFRLSFRKGKRQHPNVDCVCRRKALFSLNASALREAIAFVAKSLSFAQFHRRRSVDWWYDWTWADLELAGAGSRDTHINSDTPCCVLYHEEFHFSGHDDCLVSRVGRASHRARENRKRSRRMCRQSTKPRFSVWSSARFSANQDHVYGSCMANVCVIHKFSLRKDYRPNGLSC